MLPKAEIAVAKLMTIILGKMNARFAFIPGKTGKKWG
jgi:hypothetical protein